jgi:hypothetical protein
MKNVKLWLVLFTSYHGNTLGENQISYSKINGSGNDFMNNLYNHGLSIYGINYLKII